MVLQSIKNIVTSNSSRNYPKENNEIISQLNLNPEKNKSEIDQIWYAYQFAAEAHKEQKRKSGEPYVTHCAAVALILAEWNMDLDTIISGLLHDVIEDTQYNKGDIKIKFNPVIAE